MVPRYVLGFAFAVAAATALFVIATPVAEAQAVITNGVVTLGVNLEGDLIVGTTGAPHRPPPGEVGEPGAVGILYLPTGNDGTAAACACEAWGASYDDQVAGFSRANRAEAGA